MAVEHREHASVGAPAERDRRAGARACAHVGGACRPPPCACRSGAAYASSWSVDGRAPGGRDCERVPRDAMWRPCCRPRRHTARRPRDRPRGSRAGRVRSSDQRGSETGPGAGSRQRTWPSATFTATRTEPEASTALRAVRREVAVARGPERADAPARVDGRSDAAPERQHDAVLELRAEGRARRARRAAVAQVARHGDRAAPRASAAPPARASRGAAARKRRLADGGALGEAPPARAAARARPPRPRPAPRSSRGAPSAAARRAFTRPPSPASSSSARRSRELTVPRGRSSISAISPGVCSSR